MKCPICKREVKDPKPGEPLGSYPFCTERCKLVDLGRWLGGKYQIPVEEPDEDRGQFRTGNGEDDRP
jgi:endogenous inhibitor of DNA gyrase (YacG/DUF329 family)